MSASYIIFIVLMAVSILLLMVLKLKLSAFLSLLITSIFVGILAGMPLSQISTSIQEGMGGTLGFVATVVGLGAIFGQMLESSGGAKSLAYYLLEKFGKTRVSWALMLTGFIIGIPIFFDVGFIILVPIILLSYKKHRPINSILCHSTSCRYTCLSYNGTSNAWAHCCRRNIRCRDGLGDSIWNSNRPTFIRYCRTNIWKLYLKKDTSPAPHILLETDNELTSSSKQLPHYGIVAVIISIPLLLIIVSTFRDRN